ncbi:hypothetical protein CHRY9293_00294 [Chryseobacterium potabilaquae]|uniref:Glycosyltransferase RgtA/B/C/D-like domain-containing protein n=1 Tax=Chryseobacterium potabilaquae TaxID=2675057 RepID=A0A6N4X3B4_9FLAO|nr:hypothetical protein CHRY9293_00294 [Chryseobacterium potabilaquae]
MLFTNLFYLKYINSEKVKWLYWGALVLGIGFLNKYNIVFSLLGMIPAILLTPQRKFFFNRHLFFSGLLVLMIILPNIVWQYQNDFPVIHHMKELSERQLVNVSRLDFMKSQILFFLGVIFVIILGFYALVFYKPFEKFRFFFWIYVFTISFFLIFKAKDYYTIGLYPIYIAFGSVFLGHHLLNSSWKGNVV